MRVAEASLSDPKVLALIAAHMAHCDGSSPPESCHRLDANGLDRPGVTVLGAWRGEMLAGIGALARHSGTEGELKSMHTAATHRGRGVGGAVLSGLIALARADGLSMLRLETGSNAPFAAARALYARRGFVETPPFGAYRPDPWSRFYALDLTKEATP